MFQAYRFVLQLLAHAIGVTQTQNKPSLDRQCIPQPIFHTAPSPGPRKKNISRGVVILFV